MQWVHHQPQGRAAEGFQRVLQRHGAEAPMRFREWETQQIGRACQAEGPEEESGSRLRDATRH